VETIGVLLGLALLIVLALRGTNILIASIVSALVVAVTNSLAIATAFGQNYAGAMFGFAGRYFFLFLAGAVFGRVMGESGAAASIAHALADRLGARRALVIVTFATALLTYGGVNVFIVVFATYPLGVVLVQRANIPKRLLGAAIGLGSGTFTMTALPGSPSIQNVISAENLGTTLAAAPVLGLVAGAIMLALGLGYLEWQRRRAERVGDGFRPAPTDVLAEADEDQRPTPHWVLASLPLVVVVATILIPLWLASRLAPDAGGSALITVLRFAKDQQTLWPVAAMALATLLAAFSMRRFLPEIRGTLKQGADSSALPLLNTAAVIGFGGVVQATAAFDWFTGLMIGSGLPPLVSAAISVNIVAGIVGSASGGLGIWMPTLAQYYLDAGVPPAILHRVVTVAAGGFDTMPHCGVVITFFTIMGLTHREAYKDLFMICVAIPVVATVVIVALGMTMY
jgi:H+/gluconate symporter-like permease